MAIISQIRKRGILIIGFVGLSMFLFILGDLVTSNTGLFHNTSDVVAVIGGEKIHYREYEARIDKMIENFKTNSKKNSTHPFVKPISKTRSFGRGNPPTPHT